MLFVLIRVIRGSYVRSPRRAIHESHELTPTKPKVNWSFDTHSNAWIIQVFLERGLVRMTCEQTISELAVLSNQPLQYCKEFHQCGTLRETKSLVRGLCTDAAMNPTEDKFGSFRQPGPS